MTLFDGGAGATFDPTRTYRYRLWREWDAGEGACCFVMLNPSTADEAVLDPTIRRCIGYARRFGCRCLDVVNLFALRSTDPSALYGHADPVGSENDLTIMKAAQDARVVIAAWGVHGKLHGRGRRVTSLLASVGVDVQCFGVTKDGQPKHPLYLAKDAVLCSMTVSAWPTGMRSGAAAVCGFPGAGRGSRASGAGCCGGPCGPVRGSIGGRCERGDFDARDARL